LPRADYLAKFNKNEFLIAKTKKTK